MVNDFFSLTIKSSSCFGDMPFDVIKIGSLKQVHLREGKGVDKIKTYSCISLEDEWVYHSMTCIIILFNASMHCNPF